MKPTANLDIARVVAGHGRHVVVATPEGRRVLCHLRGKKSDCVVGDLVRWQPTGDEGVVEHLEPRRNLLFRQDAWRTKSFAANLDQILVLVAGKPMFSESQLSRALIAAESAGIPATVVLNKTDLPEAQVARQRLLPYGAMGAEVLELAMKARPDEARSLLAPRLAGRTSLVLGPSGTGKSTLINLVVPEAAAQVGEISTALNSGKHTTTTTTWYALGGAEADGALIDSPGFQEFGLHHLDPASVALLMPDLRRHADDCRFYNCTHRHEPGCGVLAALQRGAIAPSRHAIYLEIRDELERAATR